MVLLFSKEVIASNYTAVAKNSLKNLLKYHGCPKVRFVKITVQDLDVPRPAVTPVHLYLYNLPKSEVDCERTLASVKRLH